MSRCISVVLLLTLLVSLIACNSEAAREEQEVQALIKKAKAAIPATKIKTMPEEAKRNIIAASVDALRQQGKLSKKAIDRYEAAIKRYLQVKD